MPAKKKSPARQEKIILNADFVEIYRVATKVLNNAPHEIGFHTR
jgi:hypothetical protein